MSGTRQAKVHWFEQALDESYKANPAAHMLSHLSFVQ
jgi:hypothetical protein